MDAVIILISWKRIGDARKSRSEKEIKGLFGSTRDYITCRPRQQLSKTAPTLRAESSVPHAIKHTPAFMDEIDARLFEIYLGEPAQEKVMMLNALGEWLFFGTKGCLGVPFMSDSRAENIGLWNANLKFTQETCSGEGYDVTLLASDCSQEQKVAWVFLSWVTLEQETLACEIPIRN